MVLRISIFYLLEEDYKDLGLGARESTRVRLSEVCLAKP